MAGERRLTDSLREFFGRDPAVVVPIGDDAAVVRNRGAETVVACDPVVEGVHFTPGAPPFLVGRKAVNRNLSDLAAMGAVPDHLVVSLLLPARLGPRRRRRLLEGIRAAAQAAGCSVVGGDCAASPGPLVVTVTAFGHLRGRPLRRDGGRPGDALHLTGPVGGAGRGHHLRFSPHLREGSWLARQECVRAAIDVSDGLLLDLDTLLRASGGLGAVLDEDALPLSPAARRCARESGRTALDHGLTDGEDHVLLFTARGALPRGGPLTAAARRPIGAVTREPGIRIRGPQGVRTLRVTGYQHRL